ncbi:GNAT family N-acetyltransferase [Flavobacterium aestivum]|uniref:GNAT family N-acetyltransferase n=1 Tax=Flavobacterium aestivum TaxID=3003257 RepID=UPI0024830A79|nr:GNAT family N-acetyltransferase [Flavobacterium aestivum]
MQNTYSTPRLLLNKIDLNDAEFISELVNTNEWIKYIGDRNIKSITEAKEYIQKIISDPNTNYWIVRIQGQQTPIGIITFMKRDYLDHYDIGFAFLSNYTKKGYAQEASIAILNDAIKNSSHKYILATTIKENTNSIQLLEKLGLRFYKEIQNKNRLLQVYSVSVDKLLIDQLTESFFNIFTNSDQQKPNWNTIHTICLPETIIIKKNANNEEVYNLNTFIEPRKKILSDGTLTEFMEYETSEETKIVGNIAQRFSRFEKKGQLNGTSFIGNGNKLFQFVKTSTGWKISSVIWEDDSLE